MKKLNEEERKARRKAYEKAYRVANKEKIKAYRVANKEREKIYDKAYYIVNREKKKERTKAWQIANPEREKKLGRNCRYKRDYGITLEDYEKMLAEQQGRCKICGKIPKKRRLAVDHNHQTGKIRGLLCDKCNQGLGYFDDNLDLLLRAALYIEENA